MSISSEPRYVIGSRFCRVADDVYRNFKGYSTSAELKPFFLTFNDGELFRFADQMVEGAVTHIIHKNYNYRYGSGSYSGKEAREAASIVAQRALQEGIWQKKTASLEARQIQPIQKFITSVVTDHLMRHGCLLTSFGAIDLPIATINFNDND
jgi:hypothetical protein